MSTLTEAAAAVPLSEVPREYLESQYQASQRHVATLERQLADMTDMQRRVQALWEGQRADLATAANVTAALEAEVARLKAAAQTVAEETREACARAVAAAIGPCDEHRHECETDRTADAAVDAVRATPLGATPLAERIAEQSAQIRRDREEFQTLELAHHNATERIKELEAQRDAARADLARLAIVAERVLPDLGGGVTPTATPDRKQDAP